MQNPAIKRGANSRWESATLYFLLHQLKKLGLNTESHNAQSLAAFRNLNPGRQNEVLDRFRQYGEFLSILRAEQVHIEDEETPQEDIHFLNIAFKVFGMRPHKNETFGFLEKGWIIEIYNLQMRQIYRNFEFLRQCSYDLLTLESREWSELYERPERVVEALNSHIPQLLKAEKSFAYKNVPNHYIKERYLESSGIFFNSHKWVTPLFDSRTGMKAGFINFVESRIVPNSKEFSVLC